MKQHNIITLYGTIAANIAHATTTTQSGRLLKPEITCTDAEFASTQFGAICNNGDTTINITGPATCSDTAPEDGPYSQSNDISATHDEDLIYCWCKITTPFNSQHVFAYEYLYQTECENWCPNFCAQQITSNTKFRTAIFSNISK